MKLFQIPFIILLFLIQVTLNPTYAQNKNEIDSLKTKIEVYQRQDTNRVNFILDYVGPTINDRLEKNIPLIQEALEISERLKYKKGTGAAQNVFCSLYIATSDIKMALEYGLKASKTFESIGDSNNVLLVNTNLARIYNILKEPEKALEIHIKSISLIKDKPDTPSKARFYFYAAKTSDQLQDYDKAEKYYLEAKRIAEISHFPMGVAIAEGSLGHLYNQTKRFEKALPLLLKTLEYSRLANQKSNIASSLNILSDCYIGLGRFREALEVNQEAINLLGELSNHKFLKLAYLSQAQSNENIGNYKEATKFLKLHHNLSDSILSIEKIEVIKELQIKYETEKLQAEKVLIEKEKIIAQKESEQNRNYFIGAIAISVLLIISFIFLTQRIKARKKAQLLSLELAESKKRLILEKEQRKSELKALKAQMNPHFIFNALNSIQDLVLKEDTDNSYRYIVKFANLVRKILNFSDKEFIEFDEELELINTYLELEKLRFKQDFAFEITTSNIDGIEVPPMLIQPFLENALKHGLLHKEGLKKMNVNFELTDVLTCTITDNGVGREKANEIKQRQKKVHQSFSVSSIENRFNILETEFGKEVGFKYTDLLKDGDAIGTTVILKIPFKRLY